MNNKFPILFLLYLTIINFYAAALTLTDKRLAKKKGAGRIPEKRLFLAALLGGSAGMYLTMLMIRHKTKHKRFMIGLPLIMAAQLAILAVVAAACYS